MIFSTRWWKIESWKQKSIKKTIEIIFLLFIFIFSIEFHLEILNFFNMEEEISLNWLKANFFSTYPLQIRAHALSAIVISFYRIFSIAFLARRLDIWKSYWLRKQFLLNNYYLHFSISHMMWARCVSGSSFLCKSIFKLWRMMFTIRNIPQSLDMNPCCWQCKLMTGHPINTSKSSTFWRWN